MPRYNKKRVTNTYRSKERTINPMQLDLYEFRNVHGHIEVYEKQNGNFIVSDDTYKEAVSSLLEILSSQ